KEEGAVKNAGGLVVVFLAVAIVVLFCAPPQKGVNTVVSLQNGACGLPGCTYWEEDYGDYTCIGNEPQPGLTWELVPCVYFQPGCREDGRWFRKVWAGCGCNEQEKFVQENGTGL
ncbi:MAG: hypothetical protein ABH814_00220, partial [bacterium]